MKKFLSIVLSLMLLLGIAVPVAAGSVSVPANSNIRTFDAGEFSVADGWYSGGIEVAWNGNGNKKVNVSWTGNEGQVIVTPYTVANNKQTSGTLDVMIEQTANIQEITFSIPRNNGNNGKTITATVIVPALTWDEQAVRLVDIGRTMDTISYLSRDIGVRLRGTPGEETAINWILGEFEELGLETEKHEFTTSASAQRKAYVTIHDADKFYGLGTFDNGRGNPYREWHGDVWEAGAAANGYFTQGDEKITADVVFVGTPGVTPTAEDFEAANVEGKIALIGMSANSTTASRAVEAGAVGLMGFSTSLGGRGNHAQASNPSVSGGTPIPVVGLARCQGEWLMAMLKKDKVTVDIQNEVIDTPYSWNAIGTKPAKNNPDTAPIFMITAHIDSVLGAPGANDNASGVAVTLEAAGALMQLNTDDVELRFIAFGHEESGLRGSNQYVTRMDAEERARVKGVFNMDMTGSQDEERATYWCMMTVNGVANLVTETFIATAGRLGYGEHVELGQFSSSDHVAFYNAGIPAAMGMWFGRPDGYEGMITPQNYTIESVYHTPLDTIEDNVSEDRVKMCIEVVTTAVFDLARNYVDDDTSAAPSRRARAVDDADTYILTGEYAEQQLLEEAAAEEARIQNNR